MMRNLNLGPAVLASASMARLRSQRRLPCPLVQQWQPEGASCPFAIVPQRAVCRRQLGASYFRCRGLGFEAAQSGSRARAAARSCSGGLHNSTEVGGQRRHVEIRCVRGVRHRLRWEQPLLQGQQRVRLERLAVAGENQVFGTTFTPVQSRQVRGAIPAPTVLLRRHTHSSSFALAIKSRNGRCSGTRSRATSMSADLSAALAAHRQARIRQLHGIPRASKPQGPAGREHRRQYGLPKLLWYPPLAGRPSPSASSVLWFLRDCSRRNRSCSARAVSPRPARTVPVTRRRICSR